MNFDAIAEKCLDTYNNGEFAYEEGTKTPEQRQMKLAIKNELELMYKETTGKKKKALQAIASFCEQPDNVTRIRQDLRKARLEITRLSNLSITQKAYYEDIYKKEMYAQYKFERDEEVIQEMNKQSKRYRDLVESSNRLYDENRYLKENSKNEEDYESLRVHCDILEKENEELKQKKCGKSSEPKDTKKLLKQIKKQKKEIEFLKYQLKSKDDSDSDTTDDDTD